MTCDVYSINFDNILERIKNLGKNFINKNKQDSLIKPLIEASNPSMNGTHSPIFKILKGQTVRATESVFYQRLPSKNHSVGFKAYRMQPKKSNAV